MRFGCFRLFIIPATTLTALTGTIMLLLARLRSPGVRRAVRATLSSSSAASSCSSSSFAAAAVSPFRFGRLAGASPGFFRGFASAAAAEGSKEDQIAKKLREVVAATHVEVEDISGGCGSMYRVMVVSPEFEGLALVKQHRLVQKAIASEIADMHGLTLKTVSEKKYQASLS